MRRRVACRRTGKPAGSPAGEPAGASGKHPASPAGSAHPAWAAVHRVHALARGNQLSGPLPRRSVRVRNARHRHPLVAIPSRSAGLPGHRVQGAQANAQRVTGSALAAPSKSGYEILDDPSRPHPDSAPEAERWGVRAAGLPGELSAYGVGDTLDAALKDLAEGVRTLLADGHIPPELTREIDVPQPAATHGITRPTG